MLITPGLACSIDATWGPHLLAKPFTTAHGTAGNGDYRLLTLSDLPLCRPRHACFFPEAISLLLFSSFFLSFRFADLDRNHSFSLLSFQYKPFIPLAAVTHF